MRLLDQFLSIVAPQRLAIYRRAEEVWTQVNTGPYRDYSGLERYVDRVLDLADKAMMIPLRLSTRERLARDMEQGLGCLDRMLIELATSYPDILHTGEWCHDGQGRKARIQLGRDEAGRYVYSVEVQPSEREPRWHGPFSTLADASVAAHATLDEWMPVRL